MITAAKNSFPLSDFAFLPSERKNRTSVLSVFRDGSYAIEHLTPHTKVCSFITMAVCVGEVLES